MKFHQIDPKMLDDVRRLPKAERMAMAERLKTAVNGAREATILEAIDKGILTRREYDERYKDRYETLPDQLDTFHELMGLVMRDDDKSSIFCTRNDKIVADRDHLEARFGIRIRTPEEVYKQSLN